MLIFGVKVKAVPLEAWSGPEVSRKLRFPDFMKTAQDGGKVIFGVRNIFTSVVYGCETWSLTVKEE